MATLMRAFEILHKDHENIRCMLYDFELLEDPQERREAMERITREIRLHAAAEEDILYPAARESIFDTDLVDQSLEDHEKVEDLLIEAEGCDPMDPRYDKIFAELSEVLDTHIRNEENSLFPQLEKSPGVDFPKLARDLQLRKKSLSERAA